MTAPYSRAAAERLLGAAGMRAVRDLVDAAPPLRGEQREQIRAVFASAPAPARRPAAAAAEAA